MAYICSMPKPLVDDKFLLERFQGKGGWTYARIPQLIQDKTKPFGWVKVKGSIDDYKFKDLHLMPMGDSKLFLPVKAGIRKVIGKNKGDYVHVILYKDNSQLEVPAELIDCLRLEEKAYKNFMNLKEYFKREYINWIYGTKNEMTRSRRINNMIDKLLEGKTLNEKGFIND